MLNPLTKHESSHNDDLTSGDGNDFETAMSSPDTTGYIGKRKKTNSFP